MYLFVKQKKKKVNIVWRNFVNSAVFLAKEGKGYYWSGEIEKGFNDRIWLAFILAAAKLPHEFPNSYTVEDQNYYQKSFSTGIGGKIDVIKSPSTKIQLGVYTYLNWYNYQDIFQLTHFYGYYEEKVEFKKNALPSIGFYIGFPQKIGKHIELEFAILASKNTAIEEKMRKSYYFLASTGKVLKDNWSRQMQLNLKYKLWK